MVKQTNKKVKSGVQILVMTSLIIVVLGFEMLELLALSVYWSLPPFLNCFLITAGCQSFLASKNCNRLYFGKNKMIYLDRYLARTKAMQPIAIIFNR